MTDIPKVIECDTASELWQKLAPENPLTTGARQFVYRGQVDAKWHLIPSVLRHGPGKPSIVDLTFGAGSNGRGDDQIWAEHRILEQFIEACDRSGLPVPGDSASFRLDWFDQKSQYLDDAMKGRVPWPNEALVDALALAQHHGLPTRLLDWTRRAHVAVYFAAVDVVRSSEFATSRARRLAVWALDLERPGLMEELETVRVPGSTSRNIAPQQGLFTLLREKMQRGVAYTPLALDEYLQRQFAHDPHGCPLWKITAPWSAAPELLERCDENGINGAILFPGYDGAAKNAIDNVLGFHHKRALLDEHK